MNQNLKHIISFFSFDPFKYIIIKRKFNLWWSTIPPISTTGIFTSQLNSLGTTKEKYHICSWKSMSCLGTAKPIWQGYKHVNGIRTAHSWFTITVLTLRSDKRFVQIHFHSKNSDTITKWMTTLNGQTTQWSKEKVQTDKQRYTKHTYKTKECIKLWRRMIWTILFVLNVTFSNISAIS